MEVIIPRPLPHWELMMKAWRINDSLWSWSCLSPGQPGLHLRQTQPASPALWNWLRRGVGQQADTGKESRRNMIASGQGLLLSGKFLGTWRETCLNASVSHIQEFVEQKGDHAMAQQSSWRSAFMEEPRRAGEHRTDQVITTLVIPDPHSQELVPLSSSSSSKRDINSSVLFSRQSGSGYLRGLRMTDREVYEKLGARWQDLTSQNNLLTKFLVASNWAAVGVFLWFPWKSGPWWMLLLVTTMKKRWGCDDDDRDNNERKEERILTECTGAGCFHVFSLIYSYDSPPPLTSRACDNYSHCTGVPHAQGLSSLPMVTELLSGHQGVKFLSSLQVLGSCLYISWVRAC